MVPRTGNCLADAVTNRFGVGAQIRSRRPEAPTVSEDIDVGPLLTHMVSSTPAVMDRSGLRIRETQDALYADLTLRDENLGLGVQARTLGRREIARVHRNPLASALAGELQQPRRVREIFDFQSAKASKKETSRGSVAWYVQRLPRR